MHHLSCTCIIVLCWVGIIENDMKMVTEFWTSSIRYINRGAQYEIHLYLQVCVDTTCYTVHINLKYSTLLLCLLDFEKIGMLNSMIFYWKTLRFGESIIILSNITFKNNKL